MDALARLSGHWYVTCIVYFGLKKNNTLRREA